MGIFDIFKKQKQIPVVEIKKEETTIVKSNKRKTIPNDIKELLKQGNEEEVKKRMAKCQVNAYDTFTKNTILSYPSLSDDLVRYFVLEQGYDINYVDRWEKTPLHYQATMEHSNLLLFVELGANPHALDYEGCGPLHYAAMYQQLQHIKELIALGADVNLKGKTFHNTPLEEVLSRMYLFNSEQAIACIHYLLDHGACMTQAMKDIVKRMGKDFEFHVDETNELYVEMKQTLSRLYEIFDVEPVAPRVLHDGIADIKVSSTKWQSQYQELWQLLVPSSGHASTIQGEVIRISGKVSYEILDNGAGNWDKDYKMMLQSMPSYLAQGTPLKEEEEEELTVLLKMIEKKQGEESQFRRFSELMVKWVLSNPKPLPLENTNYKR